MDKFSCLRGLLLEPARSAITRFALTSANYEAAVELLKNRFGKKDRNPKNFGSDLESLVLSTGTSVSKIWQKLKRFV